MLEDRLAEDVDFLGVSEFSGGTEQGDFRVSDVVVSFELVVNKDGTAIGFEVDRLENVGFFVFLNDIEEFIIVFTDAVDFHGGVDSDGD